MPKIIGYNVYHSTDPDLPKSRWERLNDELIPEKRFTHDTGQFEPGVTHYYYVTAVDEDGLESEPSGVVSAVAEEGPPQQAEEKQN